MSDFQNATIVGHSVSQIEYGAEKSERGTPGFVVRGSTLAEFVRNPRRWRNGYVSPESDAKEYGDPLDCLVFTPSQWPRRFIVQPETYPAGPKHEKVKSGVIKEGDPLPWNGNAGWCKDWAAAHNGLTLVSAALNAKVHGALAVLKADEHNWSLLNSGISQVWIAAEYVDKATGLTVPVKCLIDKVPSVEHPIYGEGLADLKTTRNASPRRFARDCFDYYYPLKAAFYLDLYNATPEGAAHKREFFFHVVQENYPPFELRSPPPQLAQRWIQAGRWQYQQALAMYCRCVCSGHWPGYDTGTDWPITEPEPWMISMDQVILKPLEQPQTETEEADLIP